MIVALVDNDLWGKVLGRPTHCVRLVVDPLCESKVCTREKAPTYEREVWQKRWLDREEAVVAVGRTGDANVSAVIDEHVLRLEVAEDDVKVVQVLECQDCLSGEESRLGQARASVSGCVRPCESERERERERERKKKKRLKEKRRDTRVAKAYLLGTLDNAERFDNTYA